MCCFCSLYLFWRAYRHVPHHKDCPSNFRAAKHVGCGMTARPLTVPQSNHLTGPRCLTSMWTCPTASRTPTPEDRTGHRKAPSAVTSATLSSCACSIRLVIIPALHREYKMLLRKQNYDSRTPFHVVLIYKLRIH